MKKLIKRILAGTALTSLVAVSGLLTIILFPEPLFAHELSYAQFKVYSNERIGKDMQVILDDAIDLVRTCELYDPAYRFDIFLCYNSFFNKIDDQFLGKGPAARATDNNIVIKVDVDAGRNLFFPTYYQKCEGDLTRLIAHEMVHCLQEHKYGKIKFNPFVHPQYWKLEGYPEYVSRQPQRSGKNYDLVSEIERYVQLESKLTDIWIAVEEEGCKSPKYYYKSRLMTEYLIDIRNSTYDRILSDTTSEERIWSEILKWKDSVKGKREINQVK